MSAELWISMASAVVAVAALGLAVFEGRETRRHNRMSVVPKLRFDYSVHLQDETACILLVNAGLGPAIFDAVEILIDGTPAIRAGITDIGDAAHSAGIVGNVQYAVVLDGEVLPAGDTLELLAVCKEVFTEFPGQDFDAAFRRIGFNIRYRSLYNEPFAVSTNGGKFLGPGRDRIAVPALVRAPEQVVNR